MANMLKIYAPKYKYDGKGAIKLAQLINLSEIVSISPHQDYKDRSVVVYKRYPNVTSHYQGALSVSTSAIVTHETLEEVMAQLSM